MKDPRENLDELFIAPRHYTRNCSLPDPKEIKIYDTTLRDGEQMPGVAMSPEDKYLIARELSQIGCHIIDVGFPWSSPSEEAALELILQGKAHGDIREDLEILVMSRATEQDLDAMVRSLKMRGLSPGDVTVLIFTSASPLHCKYKLGPGLMKREGIEGFSDLPLEFFHEANKRMISDAIRYARSRGLSRIEFGAEDASRTPLPLLIDLVQTAVDAGSSRYVFADTTGSLTPEATAIYCRALTKKFPGIARASHFHNDFDLGVINVITGICNGFPIFSSTVNGIGERAGNAALHSVVASLKYLYGVELPDFRYERLWRIKSIVEKITGIPVQAQEPVIGFNVYSHESGIHTHGVSIARCIYEPIPFEEVGGLARMVYGKHSGAHGVMYALRKHEAEIGAVIDRDFVVQLLKEIKALREARTQNGTTAAHIEQYYQNLYSLGFSEEQVVELAQDLARRQRVQQLGAFETMVEHNYSRPE
ncbi:MAG TPA: homoaconitate hydratase [Candidatus Angelobacter sp.]